MGVARMGSYASHGSGDLFVAFATGNRALSANAGEDDPRPTVDLRMVVDAHINPLLEAAAEATEAAIVNALLAAETMVGRDGITAHAIDHERLAPSCGALRGPDRGRDRKSTHRRARPGGCVQTSIRLRQRRLRDPAVPRLN